MKRISLFCFAMGFIISQFGVPVMGVSEGLRLTCTKSDVITWDEMVQLDRKLKAEGKIPEPLAPHFLYSPTGADVSGMDIQPPEEPMASQSRVVSQSSYSGDRAPAMSDDFLALPDNGWVIPPDTNGAVGPSHLMVPLNSQVRIQNKTGGNLSTVSLSSFWSGLGVSDVFDPLVIFDADSDRFIVVTCAERRSASSAMLLAMSVTNNPMGSWYRWVLTG